LAKATAIDQLETVFKALGDSTRLRILALLGANEVCVCHIHDTIRVPQPTASRHLAYLRRAGLVETRRHGTWIHYSISRSLDPVVRGVVDAAVHALTHVAVTSRDRKQFAKCFGELPDPASTGAFCCAPANPDAADGC
jgi:ArsR family transcriptional regulator